MVDGSGLENRHTRKGIGGSNPSLSAIFFTCNTRATIRPFLRFLHIVLLMESVSYVESISIGVPNPSPSANLVIDNI